MLPQGAGHCLGTAQHSQLAIPDGCPRLPLPPMPWRMGILSAMRKLRLPPYLWRMGILSAISNSCSSAATCQTAGVMVLMVQGSVGIYPMVSTCTGSECTHWEQMGTVLWMCMALCVCTPARAGPHDHLIGLWEYQLQCPTTRQYITHHTCFVYKEYNLRSRCYVQPIISLAR